MKLSITDLHAVIRRHTAVEILDLPFSFDDEVIEDASKFGLGELFLQEKPFLILSSVILSSRRAGPSKVSPSRYRGELYITYLTKEPSTLKDARLLEGVANKFAEQTIDGIRFRTYTPYPLSKDNGFTSYRGVIDFDFEIYRGG